MHFLPRKESVLSSQPVTFAQAPWEASCPYLPSQLEQQACLRSCCSDRCFPGPLDLLLTPPVPLPYPHAHVHQQPHTAMPESVALAVTLSRACRTKAFTCPYRHMSPHQTVSMFILHCCDWDRALFQKDSAKLVE